MQRIKRKMKDKFYKFKADIFDVTEYAEKLRRTVEASPWHREENVFRHTDMVLAEFEKIQDERQFDEGAALIARMALLFHDVGKPAARTQKESVERGIYHSYPGHEQMSARELEDFCFTNFKLLRDTFGFSVYDGYAAGWMIEYHLPYDTKKPAKRAIMASSVSAIENHYHARGLFASILRSDARGRISDDKEVKLQKVEEWIREFYVLAELA